MRWAETCSLLDRWELLHHEIAARERRQDLHDPTAFDYYWQALVELCFVEDALGVPHDQRQKVA